MYQTQLSRTNSYSRIRAEGPDPYSSFGSDSNKKTRQNGRGDSSKKPVDFLLKIFVAIVVSTYTLQSIFKVSPKDLKQINISKLKKGKQEDFVKPDLKSHADTPPMFKQFKDVVMDQPVKDDDVVLFWDYDGSDSLGVIDAYTNCYDVEIDDASSGGANMLTAGRNQGFYSQNLEDLSALLGDDYNGRMFVFFRHPFYSFLNKLDRGETIETDNIMTRILCRDFTDELNFVKLGTAKRVMRENFVVGLVDEHLPQSFTRVAEYYGWKETDGSGCANKYLSTVKHDRYGELMHDNSEKWQDFMQHNKYDLQLYEYARSLFRAHAQTLISLEKQILYKTDDEEEEEENDDENEE